MREQQGRFIAGRSGNPAGRPKSARHALAESFVRRLPTTLQRMVPRSSSNAARTRLACTSEPVQG